MTILEIILFIALAAWVGAIVMRADKLISEIHKRLDEIEDRLEK